MRGFADQHAPPPMERSGQQPLLGEGSGLIEQTIRFHPWRKNGGQLIEERTAPKRAALLATLPGCAPHHLKRSLTQRQHGERALGPKQFTGSVVGQSSQGNFGGQTTLAVADPPVSDPPCFSRGGSRSISGDEQGIWTWIRTRFGQVHENVAEALQAGQQQLHQRTVIEDPANAVMAPVGGREIVLFEQNASVRPAVPQIKVAEGDKGFFQVVPNSEGRQQPTTGVGDGVGPTSLLKLSCRQRVKEDDVMTCEA